MESATCRQFVSDVVGSLRSLGVDDRIPSRLVLSKGRDYAKTYIKQDADVRRLFNVTDVWKSIPCFKMCPTNPDTCGDITLCENLMKSEEELPEVYETSYGDMVKIFTIDRNREYKQTQIHLYKDIKNREYKDANQRYFWILDRHIYIPDSEVKEVFVVGLFMFPNQVTKLVSGQDCLFPLDEMFPSPNYLISVVKTQVIKELAEIYKRQIPDARPDQDANTKG